MSDQDLEWVHLYMVGDELCVWGLSIVQAMMLCLNWVL